MGDNEGSDDVDKSTTSSSEDEVVEVERAKRIQAEIEKEKQLKRKRREERQKDDDYVPSQEEMQTPTTSSKNKKVHEKKKMVSPKAAKRKLIIRLPKSTPKTKQPSQPPSPPKSPHKSPPKQPTPPRQPTPPIHQSPSPHVSPLHLSPPQKQTLFTSQEIFQTPPISQPIVQTTPGSSGYRGDFDFANTAQVKNVEKKVDEVIAENKRLAAENKKVSDREKILEMRVKRLETDNKESLKKIDNDQSEIDILKVRVVELEEEKARRDEQNKYFEMKNKELEVAKAFKEHEFYMLNKVVEKMLGTSIEQKFEEIQVEDLRAKHQAEIDEQMKEKGKGVEGSSAVTERSIVSSLVVENHVPLTAISGLFEEETHLEELAGEDDDEDDDDDEEEGDDEDDEEDHDDEKVFSASSHSSDNDDDDDAQGGMGIKVTEVSKERNVDDFLNDSVNEESGGAEGKGESGDAQNVEHSKNLILRLDTYREEGEHFNTYTLEKIKEMTRMVNPDFKFDFEEELNAFDINHQPEYEYKYVENADVRQG
ncbi:glutamic acid-rich protein-like [Helianthus annuus]|uniref:glutamic acid-rich protein-like n=1 Tax=Helianthus annuus TaxID=4232 RepID=UPI001652C53A|nr:glutamic acid-rich protein-like [Helianthus annuus]